MNKHKDIIAWLGWMVASPLAILGMTMFLLSACAPVDLCPDLRCEYGYGEAPGEAPEPGDTGDKGEDKGEANDGQGEDAEKGEADTGKGGRGKGDKGKDGDDD